jgi:hypothetical protein
LHEFTEAYYRMRGGSEITTVISTRGPVQRAGLAERLERNTRGEGFVHSVLVAVVVCEVKMQSRGEWMLFLFGATVDAEGSVLRHSDQSWHGTIDAVARSAANDRPVPALKKSIDICLHCN